MNDLSACRLFLRVSWVAQLAKNPPTMQEIPINCWIWKLPWRRNRLPIPVFLGFPGGSDSKESAWNVGDVGLIPGLRRSSRGGHGSPCQYSCLENPHGQWSQVGYNPWGCKVLDTATKHSTGYILLLNNSLQYLNGLVVFPTFFQFKSKERKFRKLSSCHRTGQGQFSFQSQRKAMLKNIKTITQLHSFHMLARSCSKSSKLGFNNTWTDNFQLYKMVLEMAEKPEIKLSTSIGS